MICLRVGLVLALLCLLPGRAAADSFLRLQAGASAPKTDDSIGNPGFTLGGALALTRWQPLDSLAFVPQLELLFARRHVSSSLDAAANASFAMDFLELPLVLRSELTIGSRAFHVLAAAYGNVLLKARKTHPDGIVEHVDTASPVDGGLVAGGGFELAELAGGELFLEVRYQRGYRALLAGDRRNQETLALLLGYGLRSAKTGASVSQPQEQRLSLRGGLVATRLQSSESAPSRYSPGFSFGGAFSPLRVGSSIAFLPQLEVAFVHRSAHEGGAASGSVAFDSIDVSMLLRGELPVAGSTVYGMAGVYGGMLLLAERTHDGAISDIRDAVSPVDAGWLAGAGIELARAAGATLSLELRYQRGVRNLFPDGDQEVTQQSVSCLIGLAYGRAPSPRSGPLRPNEERPLSDSVAALDALEAKMVRLLTAVEAPAMERSPRGTSSCHARTAIPAGVFAMPAECSIEESQQQTREAFRAILLTLAGDISLVLARLRGLTQREHLLEYEFVRGYRERFLKPAVAHAEWIVTTLQSAQALLERADMQQDNEALWQQAGRHYEAALMGAQALSLWVSWLEFAKALHLETAIDATWIQPRVWRAWKVMKPVLDELQSGELSRIQHAAQTLQRSLPEWSEALAGWAKAAESQARRAASVRQKLLLIQAAIDLYTMRGLITPFFGRGSAFALVLPGIGGITASGAATGIRVVISAEWVRAVQHLIAIGAITSVELAKLAGISSMAMSTGPKLGSMGAGSPTVTSSTGNGSSKKKFVVDLFGGEHSQIEGALNIDINARSGLRANALNLPLKTGTVDEIIVTNPYPARMPNGSNAANTWLPEAARVLRPGGTITVTGNLRTNKFAKVPKPEELEHLGLRLVEGPKAVSDPRIMKQSKKMVKTSGEQIDIEDLKSYILERIH